MMSCANFYFDVIQEVGLKKKLTINPFIPITKKQIFSLPSTKSSFKISIAIFPIYLQFIHSSHFEIIVLFISIFSTLESINVCDDNVKFHQIAINIDMKRYNIYRRLISLSIILLVMLLRDYTLLN